MKTDFCDYRRVYFNGVIGGTSGYERRGVMNCQLLEMDRHNGSDISPRCPHPTKKVVTCPIALETFPQIAKGQIPTLDHGYRFPLEEYSFELSGDGEVSIQSRWGE
jgi:hypothetical protein